MILDIMGHLHGSVALAKNNGTLSGPVVAGGDGQNGKSLFADWILSVRLMRREFLQESLLVRKRSFN